MKTKLMQSAAFTLFCLTATWSHAQSGAGGGLEIQSGITGSGSGGRVVLTHTVWNPGTEVARNVWLTNQLPTGVSFHSTNKWPIGSPGPTYPEPNPPPMRLAPIAPGTTFDLPWTATNPPAVAVAIGDLDRDGWPDLIVAHGTNATGFSVWRNRGQNPSSAFADIGAFGDGSVRALAIGDLNGDGLPDVIVAEVGRNVLKSFFQTGDVPTQPQFVVGTSNLFSSPITAIVVADLDGDGFDDLVALEPASAALHLLRNTTSTGVPGFVEVATLPTPPSPTALGKEKKRPGRESPTLASLGRLFVTSDDGGGTVSVFIPTGQNADLSKLYHPRADYSCGPIPRAIASGDLDGDGVEDLAIANATARSVTLLRGQPGGAYSPVGSKVCDATGNVNALHLLDLDGDGRPEIITGSAGLPDCIVLPNSRAAFSLSPDQFGAPVHFDLPAPFRNLGFDTYRDGSQAGGFIVIGHTGPGQGATAGGQSFTVLGLMQPGPVLSLPLGDLEPGEATGVSLDLEVRVPDATNIAFARAIGGGAGTPPKQTPIPLGTVCGVVYCVSGGVTQGMGGFSVSVVLSGTGYSFSNSTVTMPDGSYCLQLPFSCGGVFPWDTTITVTTPACPGQSWVYPVSVMFASMTIPPVYCSNCTACTTVQNVLTLRSGSGSSGLLGIGGLDPQFTTGNPPFANANPYVTGADVGWLPDGPNSQWIGPDLAFQSFPGVFCYTNTFFMPCTNNALLTGQWSLAGEGGSVLLNGAATAISLSGFGLETSWHPFSLANGFVAGWNTLVFCVTNPASSDGTPFHSTGLRTEITGRATCCAGCTEIHCPSNIVVEVCTNGPAPYGQIVNYPPPAAFSHCGAMTNVVCLPSSGSFFPLGTNVVICTATDSLGNTASCSFNVMVRPDFTPPIILQCPPLNLTVSGCPPLMPNLTTNVVAFDNCSGPGQLTVTQSTPPGTPLTIGTTTVIVRVCDQAGNCRDCDVIVTAVPSAGCCNTTPVLSLFSGRNASGPLPSGSLDPQFKTGAPLFTTPSPQVLTNPPPAWMLNSASSKWIGPVQPWDYAPAGVFFYTNRFFLCSTNQARISGRWTADDFARILLNGTATTNAILNFWSYTNWIQVNINSSFVPGWNELIFAVTNIGTSPTGLRTEITGSACCGTCVAITCPPNVTTNICANSAVVHYSAPTASSACAAISSVQCTPPSGSTFPPGANVVICTALDTQGNGAQCSFTVNVVRLAPPLALTCPPDQTLFTCGANAVAYYKASAVGQSGSVVCTPPSGTTFPLGTNVVTCQATSPCGVAASCSFKVVVKSSLLGPPSAIFTGGTPDNFVFPMEVVTPDPCVITAFQLSSWKWFDDKARDHFLAYRFTGLPANIVKAELVIRMRPTTSVGTVNDSFFFGLTNCPANAWIWNGSVVSRPESGGTWDIALNIPTNFVFDLGALNPAMITRMNIDQYFDVVVQDDTTADYMQLRVWTCPSPSINPNGLTHFARSSGANPPSMLALMPQPELAAFGPIGNGPALCAVPPGGNPTLRNSVEVGIGGGQAYGFTTILDMNAPEDSEIVISVPTNFGTNAPLFSLVKGKCPPKCNWDIKPAKKFYDDGGGACRVASVTSSGDVLGSFEQTFIEGETNAALSLVVEEGVSQFPVSMLFDSVTGEITLTFPGDAAQRACCRYKGWDGTIKGRVTEEARHKGWDGTIKCPCYDENASRIVFTPLGTNPPPPRASIEISSTGLAELTLVGERLYTMGTEVSAAPAGAVQFQGTTDGNGVIFTAVDEMAGVTLDLGSATSFDLGLHHLENGDVPTPEQLFRLGGPRWPIGLTNRPPPPPIDLRIKQGAAGVEYYVDFSWLEVSSVTVQLWTNGVLVGEGTEAGNTLATNPLILDSWPDRMALSNLSEGLRLTSASQFGVVSCCIGNELRIIPNLPPGTPVPYAFSELQCLASAGLESVLYDVRSVSTEPPLAIHCPGDLVYPTCSNSAVVTFAVTASGNSGPVECVPPSGSMFPLGTTVVDCIVTNASGAVADCSFNVTVKPSPGSSAWPCTWQPGLGIPFEVLGGATAAIAPEADPESPAISVVPAPGVAQSGIRLQPGAAQAITFTTVLDFTAPVGAGFDVFLPPDPKYPNAPPILSMRNKGSKGYCVKMNKKFTDQPDAAMRAFAVNTNGDLLDPITFTSPEVEATGTFDVLFQPGVTNCHVTIEIDCKTGATSVEIPGTIAPSLSRKGWDGCIYGPDRPVKKPPKASRVVMIPPVTPGSPPITDLYLYTSGWPEMPIQQPAITAKGKRWGDGHVTLMKAYDDGDSLEFRALASGGGVLVNLGRTESFNLRLTKFETNLPPGEDLLTRTFGPIRGLTNRPPPPVLDSMLLHGTPDGVECSVDFTGLDSPTVRVLIYQGGQVVYSRSGVLGQLGQPLFTLPEWPSTLGKLGGRTPCRTGTVRSGPIRFPGGSGGSPAGFGPSPLDEIIIGDEFRIVAELADDAPRPDYYDGFEFVASEGANWGISDLQVIPACAPESLTITPASDGVVITWSGDSYRLQGAESPAGPWIELGAVSPVSLSPGHSARFFRLECD